MTRHAMRTGPALLALAACDFDSTISPRADVPIVADARGLVPTDTDLGYTVEITRARVAFADLEFTTEGEMHASRGPAWSDFFIRSAWAHPGHSAGGEVVGELLGRRVVDFAHDGAPIGTATMLETHYDGLDFTYTQADPADGLAVDDAMVGHTFELAGQATFEDRTVSFEAWVDQDPDRRIIGGVFALDLDASDPPTLGLVFHLRDPNEGDTVFDGIDFLALDEDDDDQIVIAPGSEAHASLRRALQVHDQWGAVSR
jgi:hypothetical protein